MRRRLLKIATLVSLAFAALSAAALVRSYLVSEHFAAGWYPEEGRAWRRHKVEIGQGGIGYKFAWVRAPRDDAALRNWHKWHETPPPNYIRRDRIVYPLYTVMGDVYQTSICWDFAQICGRLTRDTITADLKWFSLCGFLLQFSWSCLPAPFGRRFGDVSGCRRTGVSTVVTTSAPAVNAARSAVRLPLLQKNTRI